MVTLDQAGRGRGWTELRRGGPAVGGWIEHLWLMRYPRAEPTRTDWMIVPDGSAHLIVRRAQAGTTRVRLVGPRTVAAVGSVRGRRWTVGARLRPGAVTALLGLSAERLTDRGVSLRAAVGPRVDDLTARAAAASGPEEARRALHAFLCSRALHARAIDWRVRGLVRSTRGERPVRHVGDAARLLGVSERSLREVCRVHVGLSPKRLLDVARLYRAADAATEAPSGAWPTPSARGARRSWSRIAQASGYCDQAHLTRDFNRMLGESPETFRRRGSPRADSYKP